MGETILKEENSKILKAYNRDGIEPNYQISQKNRTNSVASSSVHTSIKTDRQKKNVKTIYFIYY